MDQRKLNTRLKRNVTAGLAASKNSTNSTRKKSAGRKPNPGPKNEKSSSTSLPSNLLSVSNLGNLSTMCKQCIKYLQQADMWLDTLHKASNSLNETGLFKKIMQTKGKGLSTGDLTNLLLAFMNTPLADQFFKGGSSETSSTQDPPKETTPSSTPAPAAPSAGQGQTPGYPTGPGYPAHGPQPGQYPSWPGYGTPPQYPGQFPPQYPSQYPPQFLGNGYPPGPGQNSKQNR